MKEIELSHIEVDGVIYPAYCDMNVLEILQNTFKSVNAFERELLGLTPIKENGELKRNEEGYILNVQGEPKIGAIVAGLTLMIREGQRIDTRQTGKEHEELTELEIREILTNPFEIAKSVHEVFNRCFEAKKKLKKTQSRKRNTAT